MNFQQFMIIILFVVVASLLTLLLNVIKSKKELSKKDSQEFLTYSLLEQEITKALFAVEKEFKDIINSEKLGMVEKYINSQQDSNINKKQIQEVYNKLYTERDEIKKIAIEEEKKQ